MTITATAPDGTVSQQTFVIEVMKDQIKVTGGDSSTCDTGAGMLAMMVLAGMAISRRKK